MTTPARSPQPADSATLPARRVVVVRDGRLAERISVLGGAQVEVECVPTFLAAMAHLATRGADVLVGPAAALGGIEDAGAETFDVLGGRGRVVLLHSADDPALGGLRDAGFERFLEESADDAQLAEALGVQAVEPSSPASSPSLPSLPVSLPEALPDPSPESAGPSPGSPSASAPPAPAFSPASEQPTQGDPFPGLPDQPFFTPEQHPQDLGDLDLVEAMLHVASEGGDVVPALAVTMTQQQSGLPGLAFSAKGRADVPAQHVASRVCFQGRCFGYLHAPPPTTPDQLAPWAGWLARWLCLDHQTRQLRDLAMRDELTGVWNRRYFNRFLARILERASHERQQVTLMVFDIDDFKSYNDRYGHASGDEILKSTAQLMATVVRDHDVVARIGGDEFAVIFWDAQGPRLSGSSHPDDVLNTAKRFQKAVCELRFPVLAQGDKDTLTISGGLAGFPWDGRTPEDLLHKADMMALESKRKGKNAITFGRGALRCELPPQPGDEEDA